VSDDSRPAGRRGTADDDPRTDQPVDTSATRLAERVETLERAVADGATGLDDLGTAADREERTAALAERVDGLERRVDDLEAAVQAVRGYVGAVRAVNRDVERRADAALAAVDRLADARGDELDLPTPVTGPVADGDGDDDHPGVAAQTDDGPADADGVDAPEGDSGGTPDRDGDRSGARLADRVRDRL
jgi:hypothetical protein